MKTEKEAATTANSGGQLKNYNDLKTIFLGFCEEKQLNIQEASEILDFLKDDLQHQVCHTYVRKTFDEMGGRINYLSDVLN